MKKRNSNFRRNPGLISMIFFFVMLIPLFRETTIISEDLTAGPELGTVNLDVFKYSDHLPQILKLNEDFSILIWNIQTKSNFYLFPEPFFNNGFAWMETDEEYQTRLKNLGTELIHILRENKKIRCVGLQEMPRSEHLKFFEKYLSPLLKTIPERNFHMIVKSSNQGFLYDSNFFSDIVAFDKDYEGSHQCKILNNRLQFFRLLMKDQKELFFLNLHLQRGRKGSDSYEEKLELLDSVIEDFRKRDKYFVICGDFNFDISFLSGVKNVKIFNKKNTALEYDFKRDFSYLESCDGFIVNKS